MTSAARGEDAAFMRRALELAVRGWGQVRPNPLVGAVLVREGEIVGEGWHTAFGQPHAEVEAIRSAGSRARGATLYVTLEPCSHHGKTPPCTAAVLEAAVARVVYASADPNPHAAGGASLLGAHGVPVVGGVLEKEARELNPAFFHAYGPEGRARPWLELKLALSLDARLADREGRSSWITGPAARAEVHRLRAGHDAVGIGIGTALADDPLLTVRGEIRPARPPVRVVFDRRLRLPLESRLVASVGDAPLWVVASDTAPPSSVDRLRERGARIIPAASLAEALRALRDAGLGSLLVEGGGELAAALLALGAVDRLTLFYAPLLLGPAGRSPFAGIPDALLDDVFRWRTVRLASFDDDILISFAR